MKKLFILLLSAVMVFVLASCTSGGGGESGTGGNEKLLNDGVDRIGFAMADVTGQAVQTEKTAFEAAATEMGFDECIVLSAENSVETQITQIRDLITRECDVIVIYSADADGVVPAVQSCNEAGIPVVAVDRGISGGNIMCSIFSNNISDGRDVANYFGTLTSGEANDSVKLLHIIGNLSSTAQKERADGFRLGVENWGQMTIVNEVATDADADRIYNAVVDAFKTDPDIKGIFVPYDQLLSPVVSALKEINKFYPVGDPNHVMLGAVDGATEQLEWLSQGTNDISISLDFSGFGAEAVRAARDYIDGKPVPETIMTKSIVCTAGNIDYLVSSGMLWGKQ
ncbi:MAG: sugar ABC transporter substrate-binding protein [Eubacterium sp.]|jgi:ABC-type sugar transport system substrate-binding protein|nr:sugar ABC transporter substrate-binding protein [Eubacterium sp.]